MLRKRLEICEHDLSAHAIDEDPGELHTAASQIGRLVSGLAEREHRGQYEHYVRSKAMHPRGRIEHRLLDLREAPDADLTIDPLLEERGTEQRCKEVERDVTERSDPDRWQAELPQGGWRQRERAPRQPPGRMVRAFAEPERAQHVAGEDGVRSIRQSAERALEHARIDRPAAAQKTIERRLVSREVCILVEHERRTSVPLAPDGADEVRVERQDGAPQRELSLARRVIVGAQRPQPRDRLGAELRPHAGRVPGTLGEERLQRAKRGR